MHEAHICGTKQIHLQLDHSLQLRLNRIDHIKIFFIADINKREKMIEVLNKYITAPDCADNTDASSSVSLWSFASVICATVGIASASISLVFLVKDGIFRRLL